MDFKTRVAKLSDLGRPGRPSKSKRQPFLFIILVVTAVMSWFLRSDDGSVTVAYFLIAQMAVYGIWAAAKAHTRRPALAMTFGIMFGLFFIGFQTFLLWFTTMGWVALIAMGNEEEKAEAVPVVPVSTAPVRPVRTDIAEASPPAKPSEPSSSSEAPADKTEVRRSSPPPVES